jgi:uncharacterized Tic20 family protein
VYGWPGVVYFISGGLFFFAALLGWFISTVSILNAHDKRIKNFAISVFIGTLILTLLSVGKFIRGRCGSILNDLSVRLTAPFAYSIRSVYFCILHLVLCESCRQEPG